MSCKTYFALIHMQMDERVGEGGSRRPVRQDCIVTRSDKLWLILYTFINVLGIIKYAL